MSYSQNDEEAFLLKYFSDQTGLLIDFGAADGLVFSNSRALMERGWSGVFVEANPIHCGALARLYENNEKATIYNLGLSHVTGSIVPLHYSRQEPYGTTVQPPEHWKSRLHEKPIYVGSVRPHVLLHRHANADLLLIDIDEQNYEILRSLYRGAGYELARIPLIVVEHNGCDHDKFLSLCETYHDPRRIVHETPENIILESAR